MSADFTAANEESDDDFTAANEVSDDWKKILNERELDSAQKALSKVQLGRRNYRKAKMIHSNLKKHQEIYHEELDKDLPADSGARAVDDDVEGFSGFRF